MSVCPDVAVSAIAAAIGEPARARMLFSLLDGRSRTATELAAVANVTPSTTSAHLRKLEQQRLVRLVVQGRHRYYSLDGDQVSAALEALSVLAGGSDRQFLPNTPPRLRAARTCYDHLAGTLGVRLHDRMLELGWLAEVADRAYLLTRDGERGLAMIGIDVTATRALRRRFATACLDWSERRYHLGGALGAAILELARKRRWIARDLDSRIVALTAAGRRDLNSRIGLDLPA
jgi:DNA-binding transcriptional ArsR family regulator